MLGWTETQRVKEWKTEKIGKPQGLSQPYCSEVFSPCGSGDIDGESSNFDLKIEKENIKKKTYNVRENFEMYVRKALFYSIFLVKTRSL